MGHMYFVRHGQTVWNVENKICGSTDIDLTEKGHEQAVETGKKILSENIKADIILYSPLMRAEKTAKHISEITGIPAKAEPRLTEQNFGKYEGTPRNGEEFRIAKRDFVSRYDGGESMLHLAQRIYNLLDDVKASGKVCVLVAHNGIARVRNRLYPARIAVCNVGSCGFLDCPSLKLGKFCVVDSFGDSVFGQFLIQGLELILINQAIEPCVFDFRFRRRTEADIKTNF